MAARALFHAASKTLTPRRGLFAVAGSTGAALVLGGALNTPTYAAENEKDLAKNVKGVFDSSGGFGRKPAVVVVDFCNAYTTPGQPLYCPDPGFGVVSAVEQSVSLLDEARKRSVPIYYTRVLYNKNGHDGGVFVRKVPLLRTFTPDNPMTEVVPQLTPDPETDTVIIKQYPSAFFGTPLASALTAQGVDTVILIGCSTSGCIRATALDGMQNGFRMIVPRECVGDRHKAVHESNLFDMNAKNADVVSKAEVMTYLAAL